MKIDKKLHLLVGIAMGLALPMIMPYWLYMSVIFIVAVGKEAYDKISKKGTPELTDILFTILGGLLGVVYTYLTTIL